SQPGRTSRESAVMPRISGFAAAEAGAAMENAPSMSSVRRKLLEPDAVDGERAADLRRVLVDRRHPEQRRRALHDMPHYRRRGPAAGREAVGLRRAVRLVEDRQDEVARLVDREGADEGGKQLLM